MAIYSHVFSRKKGPRTATPANTARPGPMKRPSEDTPAGDDDVPKARQPDQDSMTTNEEKLLVIGSSSYPLSRFSTRYLGHIIKKNVHFPGKHIELKSLPIPPIEVLYHELGYGKETLLKNKSRDCVFRGTLQDFRSDKFTGDSHLPTQVADWNSSRCFSKFKSYASEFLDLHGSFFWPNEQNVKNYNGITMGKDRDFIHFLMTQILFQSALHKKKPNPGNINSDIPESTPIPAGENSSVKDNKAMVLSPLRPSQRISNSFTRDGIVVDTTQSRCPGKKPILSPLRTPSLESQDSTEAPESPLARKRPRPSGDEESREVYRSHAAFWYRIVYSRTPYSVEIWKPRKSLHEMSLSELKADLPLEVGHSTQTLVLYLKGPNLQLKSNLDLCDEEAFVYMKGQMRMLIESIVSQHQQEGKPVVFDVEIEVTGKN